MRTYPAERPKNLCDLVAQEQASTDSLSGAVSEETWHALTQALASDPRLEEMALAQIEPPLPNGSNQAVLIRWKSVLNWDRFLDKHVNAITRNDGFVNEVPEVWLFGGGDEETMMTQVDGVVGDVTVMGVFDANDELDLLDGDSLVFETGLHTVSVLKNFSQPVVEQPRV